MTESPTEDGRLVGGRYRLDSVIGRGGMGVVWLAHDELLGRRVAVKELLFPPSVTETERQTLHERTLREARTAARIDHPAAVRIFDVVEEDDRPHIVMELLEGRTLDQAVRATGPLPPERAAAVGLRVADALAAAHGLGIVHRDVKPANVFLGDDGRVTLTDFGIAATAEDPSMTRTGLIVGSPAYLAPERADAGPPDPRSDLWSLGATLYTAVEGHPPFDRGDALATFAAVLRQPPAPPERAGPLAPLLSGLLVKDPAARPPLDEVRRSLAALAGRPAPPPAPAAPAPRAEHGERTEALRVRDGEVERAGPVAAPPRRPGRRLTAVVAVGLLAAGAAAGVLLTRGGGSGAPPAAAGRRPSASGSPGVAEAAALHPVQGPGGWSVGSPKGWTTTTHQVRGETVTDVAAPDGSAYLRVEALRYTPRDPVADWRAFAPEFAKTVVDYHLVGITPLTWRGWRAADWEFTYRTGPGAPLLHARDREFVTPSGAYAVLFQARDARWASDQRLADALFASFQPAR